MKRFEQQSSRDETRDETRDKTRDETRITRRDFLGKLGKLGIGILTLEAFKLGLLEGKSEAKEKDAEFIKELNELINGYLEQRTSLSKQEIRESLEKCGFIDIERLNIQELRVKNSFKPFEYNQYLYEELDEKLSALDKNNLNIIQTDFRKIGALGVRAFYSDEYKAIFINQEDLDLKEKRDKIERVIYREAIESESQRIYDIINTNPYFSDIEKDQKKAALKEWYYKNIENPKKLTEISYLVSRHRESIIESIKEFRTQEAINRVITQTSLPHEAFHYFYETMLAKEGYEGPGINELFAMAIRGMYQRFRKMGYWPWYIKDVEDTVQFFLKDINNYINNEEELNKFCKYITDQYDLTSRPKKPSEGEARDFSYLTHEAFSIFLDEYLARIYNGAVGNNPVNVRMKLEEAVRQQNGISKVYNLEETYHDPTDEELAILKQMKWKGTPILKIKE